MVVYLRLKKKAATLNAHVCISYGYAAARYAAAREQELRRDLICTEPKVWSRDFISIILSVTWS